ncbi:hypothetical protein ABGB12_21415 [Actinocorallia sp. B10E7]
MTARQARDRIIGLHKEHAIELDDLVIVEHRDNGRIKLHQTGGGTKILA